MQLANQRCAVLHIDKSLVAVFVSLMSDCGHKQQVRNVKTFLCWLAELLECGLLAGSFVPLPVIRELRDLTRDRIRLVQDRTLSGAAV
jgi:hypothetical protein